MKFGSSALAADTPRPALKPEARLVQLTGAAAVYYMFRKDHERRDLGGVGLPPDYKFAGKDSLFYRDKSGKPVPVSPPAPGFQVPYKEAQIYRDLQGYDNRKSGVEDVQRFADHLGESEGSSR